MNPRRARLFYLPKSDISFAFKSFRMDISLREIRYFIKNTIPRVRAMAPTAAPTFSQKSNQEHRQDFFFLFRTCNSHNCFSGKVVLRGSCTWRRIHADQSGCARRAVGNLQINGQARVLSLFVRLTTGVPSKVHESNVLTDLATAKEPIEKLYENN